MLPTLVATSVVRGSRQGESHGGVFLVDFEGRRVEQPLDWNTMDIEWTGRGWDRGLRGIAFTEASVLIAASDELFEFDPAFGRRGSWRNPYLKHCHEISRRGSMLYLTSTGFDSLLGFDLERHAFTFGLHLSVQPGPQGSDRLAFQVFDPSGPGGPQRSNTLHLNSLTATDHGLFFAGLNSPGLLRFDGRSVVPVASLPAGTHNAQPFRDGVLFNDTGANLVRHVTRSYQQLFHVPSYPPVQLTHTDLDDTRIARQGFGRGLCAIGDDLIAGGSSPATVALHDLERDATTRVVTLSMDVRTSIHGLEVWPFS